MTRKLKNTLIIVLTFMMTLCGSFAFSGLLARAELVSPSKEGAQTLVSIYKNGLQSGMDLVWGTATTDLGYVNSSDTQNEGKTLAVDCTHAANTEFYIDFGKDYDIYTGAGFSSETLENFYKKSAVEFWIKLNDTPASFFNIYLFQLRGEEYASAPANQRYIRSNVQLKSYVDATIIGEWQYVQVPFTAFSSNGEYVDENNVKVKDTPVNLAKVCDRRDSFVRGKKSVYHGRYAVCRKGVRQSARRKDRRAVFADQRQGKQHERGGRGALCTQNRREKRGARAFRNVRRSDGTRIAMRK